MELVTLVTHECPTCGVLHAIPRGILQQGLDNRGPNGRVFYCPNGHRWWFTGKSEAEQEKERADRLARQLDAARAQTTHERDQRHATERSNRALRAVNTRTRKRIAAGMCPCCRRTFANLAEHMSGQHPDYAGGDR